MTMAKLAAFIVAMGGAILPAATPANAAGGPTVGGSGAVPGYPSYTWQVVFFPAGSNPDGASETVLYVQGAPGTPTSGPNLQPDWMSVNGGAWYQFTNVSDGIGGYNTDFTKAVDLPPFLDPNVDSAGYAQFTITVLNALIPPTMPSFPPPSTDPPVLDSNPDPATPDSPPDSTPTDYWITDPGGDPADSGDWGYSDFGGGCSSDDYAPLC